MENKKVKTIFEIFAKIQEYRKEREKTKKQRVRDEREFNYIFNNGPSPY